MGEVATLSSVPEDHYQLTKLTVVTSPSAYPLEVLPRQAAQLLYLDGQKEPINLPVSQEVKVPDGQMPAVVRICPHKDDFAAVMYFHPHERNPPYLSRPFHDRGAVVTSAYWGNHWPATRGGRRGGRSMTSLTQTPDTGAGHF